MHIPDNFLSTPVWATLDAVSVPAVGLMVKRASRELEDTRIPLLGVMGAFVFAAQMINFPVGPGTSGHLVGGALLACALGPAPAVLVMTTIIAIQAFVFQDGGVLALGANVFNMAVVGVVAGYWPFHVWGANAAQSRDFCGRIFLGHGQRVTGARRAVALRRRDAARAGVHFSGALRGQCADRRRHNGLSFAGARKAEPRIRPEAGIRQRPRAGSAERRRPAARRGRLPAGLRRAGRHPAPGSCPGTIIQGRVSNPHGELHRWIFSIRMAAEGDGGIGRAYY